MLAPSDHCPLEPCIRMLSPAWTLQIIYYLSDGTLRFGELRRALGKVSSKVLTTRLRELDRLGVIDRKVLPTNPPNVEYSLTPMGRDLIPLLNTFSQVSETLQNKYGMFETAK